MANNSEYTNDSGLYCAPEKSAISPKRTNAKKAETEDSIILRGCEYYNKRTTATINFGFPVKEVYLCDMLENNIQKLNVVDNSVAIDFKPFEINTIKVIK